MARPEAFANRIANGIVTQIERHTLAHPELWKRIPNTIARGVGSKSDELPRPIVLVSSNGQMIEQAARTNEQWRTHMSLTVVMLVEDANGPEQAIEDLLADVWRAIASNRQLTDIETPGAVLLETGRIILGTSETFATLDSPGIGEANLDLTVEFTRSADTP